MKMENNSRKPDRLPLALLLVMGLGGTTIAGLLAGIMAFFMEGHSFAYGVLALVSIVGAIAVSQKSEEDSNGVLSMLVAFPLFIVGFTFGYMAGIEHLKVTMVLQIVVAIVSFALCRSHLCRQMLLSYVFVLVPLACFIFFVSTSFRYLSKDFNAGILCFSIIVAYMGIYAATIRHDWFDSLDLTDSMKTIRFMTAAISIALVWFVRSEHVAFAAIFAAISFAIACTLLRKYVSGSRLIAGGALALLCCASTAMHPAMAMSIAGMMLSFLILDYVCLAMFSISFICGISFFYYDLDMLLINKSYLLMASGALFLLMFYYIKRVTK